MSALPDPLPEIESLTGEQKAELYDTINKLCALDSDALSADQIRYGMALAYEINRGVSGPPALKKKKAANVEAIDLEDI